MCLGREFAGLRGGDWDLCEEEHGDQCGGDCGEAESEGEEGAGGEGGEDTVEGLCVGGILKGRRRVQMIIFNLNHMIADTLLIS